MPGGTSGRLEVEVMTLPSHVLVVESKKDPKIEQALQGPGVDVRYASELEQALKLIVGLMPAIIILDMLVPELDGWKLISKIREATGKRNRPPSLILLTDQVGTLRAANLGRVRLSDREHLGETFRDALKALEESPTPLSEETDPAEDAAWDSALGEVKSKGDDRFKAEQDRMRKLGIVDERGQATSEDRPADMTPGSKTDVAT